MTCSSIAIPAQLGLTSDVHTFVSECTVSHAEAHGHPASPHEWHVWSEAMTAALEKKFPEALASWERALDHGRSELDAIASAQEIVSSDAKVIDNSQETVTMVEKMETKMENKALSAVVKGATMGATSAGSDVLLDMAKTLFGDVELVQQALATEEGREILKALVAFGVHMLCEKTQIVPKSDLVQAGMEVQLSASAMRMSQKYAGRLMQALPRLLESDLVQSQQRFQVRVDGVEEALEEVEEALVAAEIAQAAEV